MPFFASFKHHGHIGQPPAPPAAAFLFGLSTASGVSGDAVQISAAVFTPNANLTALLFGGGAATITSGGHTDVNGFTTVHFTVPSVAVGDYPIIVTDGTKTAIGPPFSVVAAGPPPGSVTVPDLRSDGDPNVVIDPSLVKDSTAGLQAFIDAQASDAVIILPFDLVVNGQIHLFNTQVLTVVDPVAGKKALIRNETAPWRVRADTRATIGGDPNPGYNPDGICAAWQYDIYGGQANIPISQRNPYGMLINGQPPTGLTRTDGDPTVVTNSRANGSGAGGFNGSTGISGIDYDGLHFFVHYPWYTDTDGTLVNANPFGSGVVGSIIQMCGMAGSYKGIKVNKIISSVSSDHATCFFPNTDGSSLAQETSGTCAWAITFSGAGWQAFFVPNPSFEAPYNVANHNHNNGDGRYWSGGTTHPFYGYEDAIADAEGQTHNGPIALHDGASIVGIILRGPNEIGRNPIVNLDKSMPLVNEFDHMAITDSATNLILFCELTQTWGDGENGPAQLVNTYIHTCGRQGCTAHWDNKLIDHCVIEDTRHSFADIEATGPVSNVRITNNTFGFPHGIAWSSPIIGFTFTGNHSTQADVDAGTILDLCPPMNTPWKGGGSNVLISNNHFDISGIHTGDPALQVGGVDYLTVTNNTIATDGYFLQPWTVGDHSNTCTNVTVTGNTGSFNMIGQLAVPQPIGQGGTWSLLFADEFNATTLDSSRWATAGGYESGCSGRCNGITAPFNNGEFDYKTPAPSANYAFSGGALSLVAIRQDSNGYHWTGGQINTSGKAQFRYAYIEARLWVNPERKKGFGPSFWTWGVSGGGNQELDIFECYTDTLDPSTGEQPTLTQTSRYGGTAHGSTFYRGINPSDGYHIYGANVTSTGVTWYVDGVQTKYDANVVSADWYPILYNPPMDDGTFGKNRAPSPAGTTNNASMKVDYVRVWQSS